MIRAIFWDNDGVLVDTEGLYFLATRQVLTTIGVDLTEELYRQLFLKQGKGAWHLAEKLGAGPDQIAGLRRQRDRLYSALLRGQEVIMDGVAEVLSSLYGKYVMGIVTSSQRDHFDIIHTSSGLLRYFDFVVAAGDYTKFKPDPEPYVTAVARSGFSRSECIAVEDSERGLASALGAGIRCLVIPNDLTRAGCFEGAHKVLSSVKDVVAELSQ